MYKFIQVRYIGVSNETSYGVMEFVHAAKVEGLPKIVSIQNSYSLLVRCKFEGKLFSFIILYYRGNLKEELFPMESFELLICQEKVVLS